MFKLLHIINPDKFLTPDFRGPKVVIVTSATLHVAHVILSPFFSLRNTSACLASTTVSSEELVSAT